MQARSSVRDHRRWPSRAPAELFPAAGGSGLRDAGTRGRAGAILPPVSPPSPADLAQQGAHDEHRPGDPAPLGLELSAQRLIRPAVSQVQRRLLPPSRRSGALPGRVRPAAPPRGAVRHPRGADRADRGWVPGLHTGGHPALPVCHRGGWLGEAVPAADHRDRARRRLRGYGDRPGGLRRPAGPDHRERQLGVRDLSGAARARGDGAPGQPEPVAPGVEHQAPGRRARPVCRDPGQLPVQDAAFGARLHNRRDPPRRRRFEAQITYTHAEGEQAVLEYESVIRCTGFRMDTTVFGQTCHPEMTRDARMPALRPDWQSANVDDLYFAGTIAQDRDCRHASSPFIDGFRYNLRTLTSLLRERYDGVPLACEVVPADPDRLTSLVLDRVNWSSALWTQFEYLCDVLVVDEVTGQVRHYCDLPEDYAVSRFADASHYYTVALRWGREDYGDVFAIDRHPVPGRAAESAFIHPVVRRYRGTEVVAEQHLLEDLLAEWRRPDRHIDPLRAFFASDLG